MKCRDEDRSSSENFYKRRVRGTVGCVGLRHRTDNPERLIRDNVVGGNTARSDDGPQLSVLTGMSAVVSDESSVPQSRSCDTAVLGVSTSSSRAESFEATPVCRPNCKCTGTGNVTVACFPRIRGIYSGPRRVGALR